MVGDYNNHQTLLLWFSDYAIDSTSQELSVKFKSFICNKMVVIFYAVRTL